MKTLKFRDYKNLNEGYGKFYPRLFTNYIDQPGLSEDNIDEWIKK